MQQRCCSRRAVLLCCNVIRIGRGRSLPLRPLQAGHSSLLQRNLNRTRKIVAATAVAGEPFSFAATKNRIGRGIRCRYDRCRRAILYRHDDCAASIPKSGLEIKNRCTKEGVNGEIPASIRKSGPEIKNRCMKDGGNRENPASIRKSGPEIKNRCTKQPIFSTLPQQIPQQIPQHIPQHAFHHALTTRLALDVCMGRARAGLTVAAKAGADAPGGGISLCFCRRGCAAPAHQAATLNDSRRSTRPKAATLNAASSQHPPRSTYLRSTRPTRLHANSFCRISSHRRWRRTVCVSLQAAR